MGEMRIQDRDGRRLYFTPEEREAFAEAAKNAASNEARTLCRTLYYTGCRPAEAILAQVGHIEKSTGQITLRTLKKRSDDPQWRTIPLPSHFIDELNLVHNLKDGPKDRLLWPVTRVTAWSWIKQVIAAAGIESGPHASPKGLRHGFGIASILNNVPLPTLQKWLGHEKLETTAIYTQAIGKEERALAARNWGENQS